jgi:hypothetical protein
MDIATLDWTQMAKYGVAAGAMILLISRFLLRG